MRATWRIGLLCLGTLGRPRRPGEIERAIAPSASYSKRGRWGPRREGPTHLGVIDGACSGAIAARNGDHRTRTMLPNCNASLRVGVAAATELREMVAHLWIGRSTNRRARVYTGVEKGNSTMKHDPSHSPEPMFSQIDVSHGAFRPSDEDDDLEYSPAEQTHLLRELIAAQDRQNELLEELVSHLGAAQRQRQTDLGQWKKANPRLAKRCRHAAETLGKVQMEFLEGLTDEIGASSEQLIAGDFMLNEFIDRYGPRMAHLNGLLQVLSQLSSTPNSAGKTYTP